jgi:hypothetical protein
MSDLYVIGCPGGAVSKREMPLPEVANVLALLVEMGHGPHEHAIIPAEDVPAIEAIDAALRAGQPPF